MLPVFKAISVWFCCIIPVLTSIEFKLVCIAVWFKATWGIAEADNPSLKTNLL